ncbi:CcdB family protein [Paracoccus aminophilus]|uniref:Toxin CcdB n=1 Tax=Paracoccus aminophilus JCM 7686 TaxID=1367847 RepID=S5Y6X9_PARAH|nr:CcdB family protein [Paracoccus aminophilus]AGT11335.1 toxin (CcdB-type) of toxin-antitoxin system [Paracoccus aminophilus JCM 7686]
MARFDLYRDPAGTGLLLDVQSDLLADLNTRIVVPVMPLPLAPKPAAILNPVFALGEAGHVMVTQYLSAVPASLLREKTGSLAGDSDRITRALDFLYQGF